jgi:hypothetical protein
VRSEEEEREKRIKIKEVQNSRMNIRALQWYPNTTPSKMESIVIKVIMMSKPDESDNTFK